MGFNNKEMSKTDTIPREGLIEFIENRYTINNSFSPANETKKFMNELDIFMGYKPATDDEIMAYYGWERECIRPHEIRHREGSFASGWAADVLLSSLREEYKLETLRS